MKLKNASKALIAVGTTVLIYALFVMDISLGGGIINLDLMNTRQNLVMLGALGVLGGIILYATSVLAKNTAPKDEPQQVDVPLKDRADQALLNLEQLTEKGLTSLEQWFERCLSKFDQFKHSETHDRLLPVLKVISWLSFLAPPFGLLLIGFFLFAPKEAVSFGHLFMGLALIYSPYGLRNYRRKK